MTYKCDILVIETIHWGEAMRSLITKISILLTLVIIVTACSSQNEANHQEHTNANTHEETTPHEHVNGDIQEETASADILPSFLEGQDEQIRLVYAAAGKATEILKWMPCYCGCGESAGHKSNLNCFIKEVKADGTIVWDDHGTRCGVCLQIAVNSIRMTQDGKSLKEIRTIIDETYADGYAEPTKTDFPA